MADVYKFKVKLKNLEEYIWRDIEITSVSSVAKLGYAVLAAFEGTASHLFCIHFNGKRYEIKFEDTGIDDETVIDPIKTKLAVLKLTVGDTLRMEYDYGAGWAFSIELISITEMKRGAGTHYPFVIDGKGKGIIEDISPYELIDMKEQIDNTGILPKVYHGFSEREMDWDYREFDLEYLNMFLKGNVLQIQYAYEVFE